MSGVAFGRGLCVAAAAAVAVLSFTYHDFAPMWQSVTWLYGCEVLLLAAGTGLCFARTALPSALAIGAYYSFWAVASIPPILAEPLGVDAWYGFFEASCRNPRSAHDELVRPTGLDAEPRGKPSARVGDGAQESMVRDRGEFAAGRIGVDRRRFLAKSLVGLRRAGS